MGYFWGIVGNSGEDGGKSTEERCNSTEEGGKKMEEKGKTTEEKVILRKIFGPKQGSSNHGLNCNLTTDELKKVQ